MTEFSISGRLDPLGVRAFDDAVDHLFAVREDRQGDAEECVERIGARLLGSRELSGRVVECLAEGPREGDVFAALAVLWDLEVLDLDAAALDQVQSAPAPFFVW